MRLRSDDIWLASYPRSGNTRLRMLLGQAKLLNEGSLERCVPGNVEEIMPVWGFSDMSKFPHSPRFVKTHRMYLPIMSRPNRTVFMLRDPRETVASAYRMFCSRKNVGNPEFEEFLKHPRHGLPGWIRMHQRWMPRTTSVVYYRDLMSDAAKTVLQMCQQLDVDYSADTIRQAAEMTDRKNAKNAEQKSGIRDASRFDGSFTAVGPGNHAYAAELFKQPHLDYVDNELSKANIQLEELVGSWATASGASKPTIEFRSNDKIDPQKLASFFQSANVPQVTETFRAFELSQSQAKWIADYEGNDNYFLALSDGEIAGFGMLRGWDEGYAIPSLGLFVSPTQQGKGIGKAIMKHLTETATQRGCERIRLTVDAINEKAVALYKAQNYKVDTEQSDSERFVMYRNLGSVVASD